MFVSADLWPSSRAVFSPSRACHRPVTERFQHALEHEDEHLQEVRRWVEELTLKDASIVRH